MRIFEISIIHGRRRPATGNRVAEAYELLGRGFREIGQKSRGYCDNAFVQSAKLCPSAIGHVNLPVILVGYNCEVGPMRPLCNEIHAMVQNLSSPGCGCPFVLGRLAIPAG
jgi:hypothetical protein